MRNLLNKSVSFIVALAIVLGFSAPAFTLNDVRAYQVQSVGNAETAQAENEAANIQALKEMFAAMTPGAIEIYESTLGGDKEQLDFYVEYIKPGFELKEVNEFDRATAAIQDLGTRIQLALIALKLNYWIRTAFMIITSGLEAMLAGVAVMPQEAVAMIMETGGFTILALNYTVVEPHWDQIVNIFRKEFRAYDADIVRLFDGLKARVSVYEAEKKSTEEMLKKADGDEHKQEHIIPKPPNPKHNWWKLIAGDVTWKEVRKLIEKAMLQGVESPYKNGIDVYQRDLKLDTGHNIKVVFKKMTETLWRISDAWVE